MVIIGVSGVGNFGGFIYCIVDGDDITVDKHITHEGIEQVNKIVAYGYEKKQDMSLVDAREEYACAGSA